MEVEAFIGGLHLRSVGCGSDSQVPKDHRGEWVYSPIFLVHQASKISDEIPYISGPAIGLDAVHRLVRYITLCPYSCGSGSSVSVHVSSLLPQFIPPDVLKTSPGTSRSPLLGELKDIPLSEQCPASGIIQESFVDSWSKSFRDLVGE